MKRAITFLLLLSSLVFGQTTLSVGDIAIVGFNFDEPDEFAFVLLTDVTVGTEIKFTDNGWLASGSFRGGEGTEVHIFESNTPKGTIINIQTSLSFNTTDGDQILVYQGESTSPNFIFALNSCDIGWQDDATNASSSALPLGLINGSNAIALEEIDNSAYVGNQNLAPEIILLSICNTENWSGSNSRITLPTGNYPLPVELTTFSASVIDKNVKLNWETATEVNNYGFDIERKSEFGNWSKLGFVQGNGNSNSSKFYNYIDQTINISQKYFYRLKQIDIDGKFEYSDEVEVCFTSPEKFELLQNYPNPFNPITKIKYSISDNSNIQQKVVLKIYNVLGQVVKTLVNENKHPGIYEIEFNGNDLMSGIYFYKLEVGNFIQMRKMVLTK